MRLGPAGVPSRYVDVFYLPEVVRLPKSVYLTHSGVIGISKLARGCVCEMHLITCK
jgi:hypothetical protein